MSPLSSSSPSAVAAEPTTYQNLIDGRWSPSRSGKTYPNENPADTHEVLGLFPDSDAEDAQSAVDAAAKALPAWRSTPAPKRGDILQRAATMLGERAEELATALTREEGKTIAESRGEVQRAVS